MKERAGMSFIDSMISLAKGEPSNAGFLTSGPKKIAPEHANADRWIDYQILTTLDNQASINTDPKIIGRLCTAAKLQLEHNDPYFLVSEKYLQLLFTASQVKEKQTKAADLHTNSPILVTRPTLAEILQYNGVSEDLIAPMVNLTPLNDIFTVNTVLYQCQNITSIFQKTVHQPEEPSRFKALIAVSPNS